MPIATQEPETPHSTNRLWVDVRAAIAGKPRDYTSGSVNRAILLLAVPMVLEMAMQSAFTVVDVYFVGKLGSNAVAIVGLGDSLISLVFAVAIGLAMGTTAMVARRVGEGKNEEATQATVQAILLCTALSIPILLIGVFFSEELFRALGATARLAAEGRAYGQIFIGGSVTVMLLFVINAAFRGAGDPALAMRALWIANLLNIVLDPLFIFGWGPVPAFGVAGAAIATTVGRGVGVFYQLYKLCDGRGAIRVRAGDLEFVPTLAERLFRVSGIGIFQYLISTASFIGMIRILAIFGDIALAGYTIGVRVIIFILLPAWAMGNAAATLVGQNLGARQPERAERSVWVTARYNAIFLGLVTLFFITVPTQIVSLFSADPEVIRIAASCLRIVSLSYVFWGFGMITVLAFNGAGDTKTPTWINFFVLWVFQIPLAYLIAVPLGYGPNGVFTMIAASQTLYAVVGVIAFRRGTWKSQTI